MIDFSKPYNREDFLTFLEDDLLPNDFEICEKEIPLSGFQQRFVSSVTKLGTCKSLGLDVFEMKHQSLHDARVGISKDAFQIILHKSLNNRALVVFLPHQNNEQYRFSLIQIETSIEDDKLRRSYSNPRRYSYILGKGTPTTTPTQFLGKGRIRATEKNSLFDDLQNRFSVEVLTKQFYNELFEWYQWALSPQMGITYPNNTDILSDDRHKIEEHLIRLITRIMFVWFIKQKKLVPDNLFEIDFLKSILKDFDPQSRIVGNYYNAILQNLFFATLNKEIGKRDFAYDEDDRNMRKEHYGIKTLYRYKEMFSISDNEIVKLFQSVPFLNGGLFECLDKEKDADTDLIIYYDGFSRNKDFFPNTQTYKCRAFIPNQLFFDEQKGLIPLLAKYNFTVEENSPNDADVALDPELLGKVFENLLGAYNPETKETARNQSGSFYTPREIVDYMVNESLIAYTESSCSNSPNNIPKDIFRELFTKEDLPEFLVNSHEYCELIANKLRSAKILDPACGSGAFPMGILNKMVRVLEKLDCRKEKTVYAQKLHLIENCIYGVDIQNIAVQISKLRFFISLICEQEKDETKPNYGIPTLPNLETKFVAANTLIDIKKRPAQGNLFEDPEIEITQKELLAVRKQHFSAINAQQKAECRFKDKQLREKLAKLLATNEEYSPDDAIQMAHWNPYDQNATSLFFDAEWMFGVNTGFDIVIGNPPYIQLQNNGGELGKLYAPCNYITFASTGDIYSLFYERGWQLLKEKAHLCFITSNKWMRAGYGEATRIFFSNNTNPIQLIDFGGIKIFESATVDTNILLFSKNKNQGNTLCVTTKNESKESLKELSVFVQQKHTKMDFSSSNGNSWVILSDIEQSIKKKIEAVGTPLKDWDIQINYGIKTGFNEAFIIPTEKRDEILNNCKTEEERKKTDELIRPILRGRDIKRYGYDWKNLWIIYIPWHFPLQFDSSIQGASKKAENEFLKQYPAVYKHMLQYKNELSARNKAETGIRYEWYAMQRWGANYWEDFLKPKIVYPNMTKYLPFVYDNLMFVTNQKCFIITGKYIAFLTAFFNSSLFKYCFRDSFPELQGGTRELSKIFFDKTPVIQVDNKTEDNFVKLVSDIQNEYTKEKAVEIDQQIFDLYNLSEEEKQTIGFIEIK